MPWNNYNAFLVNSTDVEASIGCISSWDGIMSEPKYKGDLIEMDWVAGATWQQGPVETHSFEVPIAITGATFTTVAGWAGQSLTLTRRRTVGVTNVSQTCTAILASAIEPRIQGRTIRVVLVFQVLSGGWA